MMPIFRKISSLFEGLLFFYVACLFLSLGSDFPGHYAFRLAVGFLVAVGFVFVRSSYIFPSLKRWPFLLFGAFVGFEWLRFFWALASIPFGGMGPDRRILTGNYLGAPISWTLYFLIFCLGYCLFYRRRAVRRLLVVTAWCGFFLAMNAIPALLITGETGYPGADGRSGFFFPIFYFHPWMEEFLLSRFAHVNITGDVLAFGFFPALALVFYSFRQFRMRRRGEEPLEGEGRYGVAFMLLKLTLALSMAAAILLFFSRGTILFFSLALGVYFLSLLLKFPSRRQWVFALGVLGAVLGFLVWTGKVGETWQELRTLGTEIQAAKGDPAVDPFKASSIYTNLEGARRALAIYKDHPIWGVGTTGYTDVSPSYAAKTAFREGEVPGRYRTPMADFESMCHYLHLLAEEGAGAYLYFLFLAAYAFAAARGLVKTHSRFKFFAALSLLAPVLMVFGHAWINHLMQRFSVSLLVYLVMGSAFGVLREDFEHEAAGVKS